MKIAIVHDWLVTYAGAERVLEQLLKIYPYADVYSIIDFLDTQERSFILNKKVNTSFIQKLPFARKNYRNYLPLMPIAIEQLDVTNYDIVISSSHAVAKGIITGPNQLHISYVHSPIRYAWDLQHQYLKESGLDRGIKGWIAKAILHYIRNWDYRTSNGVDYFIANSKFISRRIWKVYRRQADVIYPPVNVSDFSFYDKKDDYYITASRLVPYKKVDLIVEAFSQMPDKKLVVIGNGPDFNKVKEKATPNIELLGYQSADVLKEYMQHAKAFVFAGEEDFGIAPVEAQACGTPVIAYGKGGVLETIRGYGEFRHPTGLFFKEQTVSSIVSAIHDFENISKDIKFEDCRENALRFSSENFIEDFKSFVDSKLKNINKNLY